jgi:hypothetical protein
MVGVSERPTTWVVRASVSVEADTTWAVLTAVAVAQRSTAWTVRVPMGVVTRSTTWKVDRRVLATRSTTWDVFALINPLLVLYPWSIIYMGERPVKAIYQGDVKMWESATLGG